MMRVSDVPGNTDTQAELDTPIVVAGRRATARQRETMARRPAVLEQ
jgi:hypothetical protein